MIYKKTVFGKYASSDSFDEAVKKLLDDYADSSDVDSLNQIFLQAGLLGIALEMAIDHKYPKDLFYTGVYHELDTILHAKYGISMEKESLMNLR